MVATVWLLGCMLAPAQPSLRPPVSPPASPARGMALRGDWVLTPRLGRGQELVYRGTFTEIAGTSRVEFQRAYRLESRFFTLETPPRGTDLVAMTLLYTRDTSATVLKGTPAGKSTVAANSVRLERMTLDLQGKISASSGLSLVVPLDGAPALEVGAFLEVPRGRLALNQGWETSEVGRPLIAWRLVGTETIAGQTCIKVSGTQQSDDWEQPRADRSAWRRQENMWISPRNGFTTRLERTIEQREPARREVTRKSVLRYDLESSMQYPAIMAQDRRTEINLALKLREEARPLVGSPARNMKAIQALQRRIASQVENQPATPYRECVLQVKRIVEAAGRGEVVSLSSLVDTAPAISTVATVGQPAPDFVASEVAGQASARLTRWKGRPLVLIFYDPESYTASDLLRFAQELHVRWGKHASVVGLCVSDDKQKALRQRDELRLTFPLLHGAGMRISYQVETTPKLIVIDSCGLVRGTYFGWGRETPAEVVNELRTWVLAH